MHLRVRIALLVAAAIIVAACSAGSTADDYFADLAGATSSLDDALDEVEASFNAGLLDINFEANGADQQFIDLFQASIGAVNEAFAGFAQGLSDLDPPPELAAAHQEALDAGLSVVADYEARSDQLGSIATVADIDVYAEGLATSVARTRFVASCNELQEIADRDRIEVDLSC
ncbi:MAG: hypothetical protein OER12_07160 [Acidimicrobiia bacterium]|nr:hypothetical protein [Acidimicrobiia bacterium]